MIDPMPPLFKSLRSFTTLPGDVARDGTCKVRKKLCHVRLLTMHRPRVFSPARVTGHVSWWVFVVATLFANGTDWFSGTVSFPAVDPAFSARSGYYTRDDGVFSDYYGYASSSYDPWTEPELWSHPVWRLDCCC